jgi:urease accessory protein
MESIRDHLHAWDETRTLIPLPVDRLTLAKRRWRKTAADGHEFGFDLEHPLSDGDFFFQNAHARYRIEQQPEPVLVVPLGPGAAEAARLGWKIGNLHFPIAITAAAILAPDDPAVRQLLEREGIVHRATPAVFRPLQGSHSHGVHQH